MKLPSGGIPVSPHPTARGTVNPRRAGPGLAQSWLGLPLGGSRLCESVWGRQISKESKEGERRGEEEEEREEESVKLWLLSFLSCVPKCPPEGALSQHIPPAGPQAPGQTKMDHNEEDCRGALLPKALLRPRSALQPPGA